MGKLRRRFKQCLSLQDRLRIFSEELKDQASKLAPGPEQDALLKRAHIAETAFNIDQWASWPVRGR